MTGLTKDGSYKVGEDGLPTPPTDEEVAAVARKLGAPVPDAE